MTHGNAKKAVLIGAATGIGRATALRLARQGASIVIGDINEAGMAQTAGLVREIGAKVETRVCDIGNLDSIERFFDATGPHDVAVNLAAFVQSVGPLDRISLDEIDRSIQVNYRGLLLCVRRQVSAMPRGGAVVNVASAAGLLGAPNLAVYSSTKHAVVGLTRAVGAEVATRGIRVNAVCPGPVPTQLITQLGESSGMGDAFAEVSAAALPLQRMATVDEIAAPIVWLLGDEASYITCAAIAVDGGYTGVLGR